MMMKLMMHRSAAVQSATTTKKTATITSRFSVVRYLTTTQQQQPPAPPLVLGILRENYDKWERRSPLSPRQCQEFINDHPGSQVIVQPSSHRIFSNVAYERAGAIIQEELDDAHVVLGVKRPRSMESLPSEKTYMFFSHVIKGQPENMVRYIIMNDFGVLLA